MSESQLKTLLEEAINVTFLAIVEIDWLGQESAESQVSSKKLDNLTELVFDRNGGHFPDKLMGMIPSSLNLLYLDLDNQINWSKVQRIFRMQQNLINLRLSNMQINEFEGEPELNKLKVLRLQDVKFNGQAFQNFIDFIKRQKDLENVEMEVRTDEIMNGNSYNGVIKDILKKNTLKSLSVTPGSLDNFIATLDTPNPTLEMLVLTSDQDGQFELSNIVRYFPNITNLVFFCRGPFFPFIATIFASSDFRPLNTLKKLKQLSLIPCNDQMLEQIDMNSLNWFTCASPVYDNDNWEGFIRKHQNLVGLMVISKFFPINQLRFVEEHLPKLENLDCYGITEISEGSEKSVIQIVGKLYQKLKFLHVEMEFPNVEEAIQTFRASFPNVKIEIRNDKVIVRKPLVNQIDSLIQDL
jgi:hypothetical protein